jgi:hypothetical protein
MDDYTEIYFVDEDEMRNATRDHRSQRPPTTQPPPSAGMIRRPSGGSRVVIARPAGNRPVVMAAQPQTRFGGLSTGQLVEVGAQILAAIQPLPAAPVATGKADTDVGNLILYQGALAVHAKRDEQLRTLGSLVGKLLG